MSSNGMLHLQHKVLTLTLSREAGRERLIEDQKLKRENEVTHRAAL
jgi:hypothetical protein